MYHIFMSARALSLSIVLFFFLYAVGAPHVLRAESSLVVFTEIGAYEPTDHEWVEIFNRSGATINLEGWKFGEGFTDSDPDGTKHGLAVYQGSFLLEPGTYAIIAQKADSFLADYPDIVVTIFDSSWGTLKESGERIQLLDNASGIQEDFTYIASPDTSLERLDPLLDDYTATNWQPHPTGNTAGFRYTAPSTDDATSTDDTDATSQSDALDNTNSDTNAPDTTAQHTDSSNGSGGGVVPISFGDVLMNEFVADPTDDDTEWVELYNTTAHAVTLDGWTLEDGAETETTLSGSITTRGFFIIEKPKGKLNNTGDILFLYAQQHELVDRVTYGSWDDGNTQDNAPKAGDPLSVARKIDGLNSFNNGSDFAVTTTPTKGAGNVITAENTLEHTSGSSAYSASAPHPQNIILNELYPNPPGTDDAEFIELLNVGSVSVDVSGWLVGDSTAKRYTIAQEDFGTIVLTPMDFLLLPREITGIALNNTGGETVKLFYADETLADSTTYTEKSEEGMSYARDIYGKWQWTLTPTKGKTNVLALPNQPPVPFFEVTYQGNAVNTAYEPSEILAFDASDTTDPDNNPLTYVWDFGDSGNASTIAPLHIFSEAGSYRVQLTVSDGVATTATSSVLVIGAGGAAPTYARVTTATLTENAFTIFINELYPNPDGDDAEGEFIELANARTVTIDLANWSLDDDEGGSHPYTFPEHTFISPQSFLAFPARSTHLTLNNTHDAARLFAPDGTLVDSMYYDKVVEGASYGKFGGEWQWTAQPTPGEINVLLAASTGSAKGLKKIPLATTLAEVRSFDVGTYLTATGTVAVAPGVFGKTTIYITGSPGIQVYLGNGDWPDITVGDIVGIIGTLGTIQEEYRLKLASKDAIEKIAGGAAPQPITLTAADITKEYEGSLVKITGEISQKRGNSFYLDDGTEEVRIYIKDSTDISASSYTVGDRIAVSGIVSHTNSGFRLLPRGAEDITPVINGMVAGASELGTDTSVTLPPLAFSMWDKLKKYAGAALIVIGFFGILFALFAAPKDKV